MEKVLGMLLIEQLRQEGVLSEEQAKTIVSIVGLSQVLEEMKVISPLSSNDKRIMNKMEEIIESKIASEKKVKIIGGMSLVSIENESLKKIMIAFRDKVEKWGRR